MTKFSSKGLLGIAFILSILIALSVYSFLYSAQATVKGDATVVVAKVEILPNTLITAEMVEQIVIPSQYLQPGAMTDISKVLGIGAKEHILQGEQVTERLIMNQGRDAGFAGIIPGDKRAVSVSVNDIIGVAGLIKPGDYVDVIATFPSDNEESVAKIVFENVLVLATDKNTNPGAKDASATDIKLKDEKATTITIAITPEEVTKLAIVETKGKIIIALRPYSAVSSTFTSMETRMSNLVGYLPHVAPVAAPSTQAPMSTNYSAPIPYMPAPYHATPKAEINWSESSNSKNVSVIKGTDIQNVSVN